ncbi:hypothetical protein [Undibacterium sp. CY21W]|uniref:hypothetical protein n=1 Tax=Undibacterium sp. CY21W TaxID=2762293 RepID=UPI00164CC674|nr:hypothetical protein [Undibacterium sp. CY21W]MBC3927829.1 hypothetical protein [Undibacterium sp. CY21W]
MSHYSSLYLFSPRIEHIVRRLKERKWIIHNFNCDDVDLYNPANYLYNKDASDTEYNLILDANIFQFSINATKNKQRNDYQRDAIALIAFCQIAGIEIDPTYAIYEKAFHSLDDAKEAALNLSIFHKINNSSNDDLANFALGHTDHINLNHKIITNEDSIVEKITRYKKLKTWDSLYLMCLKLADIKFNDEARGEKKIKKFVDWCIFDFRFSIVALVFSIIYFGRNPQKKMMKFSPNDPLDVRRQAISNMTWDMYNASQYFEKWREDQHAEYMFASDDKAFGFVLTAAVNIQNSNGDFNFFRGQISDDVIIYLNKLNSFQKMPTRSYKSAQWNGEYRKSLITELENKILT